MKTVINGKEFKVEKKGNRYYYFSFSACRNLPVAKDKVIFDWGLKNDYKLREIRGRNVAKNKK